MQKIKVNKKLFMEKAEEKGLTQEQIANRLGKSRSNIVTFLNSKHLKQIEFVVGICALLDIKMNELITYEQESNNNKK